MPEPNNYETEKEFLEVCIPAVIEEGKEQDQAVAICKSMWAEKSLKTGARNNKGDRDRIRQVRQHARDIDAITRELEPEDTDTEPELPEQYTISTDAILSFGGAVKALGGGKVGGYLVRFSTDADPDLTDEFFTKDTDFGDYDTSPVYYEHGMDDKIRKRKLGKASLKKDDLGVWAEAQLALRDEYEEFIYQMAEAGKLGWSSGTAPHLVEREEKGKAIWLKSWQLGLDASLTPHPAEYRNTVIPLKSYSAFLQQSAQTETPTGTAEAAQAAPGDGVQVQAAEKSLQEVTMEISEEKLAEIVKAAATEASEAAVKKISDVLPTNGNGGVTVTHDEADNPFVSIADQCRAVKSYEASRARVFDPRLKRLDIKGFASGASEGVPSEGGFLLEPTLVAEVLKPMHEVGPFTSAVRKLPVGANSNYGWINGVDESSRADGSRWGGILGYRLAEAASKTASKPAFRRISWELKKYAVLVYATDELLADASMFSEIVRVGAAEELMFMANDDILNGDGIAGPYGILNSPCLVSVTAESGQDAATIVYDNLVKMWARLDSRSKANAAWFINTDCNPQLDLLLDGSCAQSNQPRFMGYNSAGIITIKGRPVIETEFNATLGTVGDILLADMSQYLFWEKQGIQAASSIHLQFLTDEETFRFVYRCDGTPALSQAITPYKGSLTLSPFVALATRS